MGKVARQDRILDIILRQVVSTQEELVDVLKADGVDVTQATISRDIKELNIVKVTLADGRQKYVSMSRDKDMMNDRLIKVFTHAATYLRIADSIVVIRTLPGMAQAAAAAVDAMQIPEIIGTLAGDDTIFVATASPEMAKRLEDQWIPLIEKD